MKQDSLFWAICNLEDDLILEAEEGKPFTMAISSPRCMQWSIYGRR